MMILTYTLLALSIGSVWLSPIPVTRWLYLPPWLLLFLCAAASGLTAGYLRSPAIMSLGIFLLFAYLAQHKKASRTQRMAFSTLTALIALALATHRLPGFSYPTLLADIQLSPDAASYTLHANFDKGAVGLILLALFCRRTRSIAECVDVMRKSLPVMAMTFASVLALAISIGYIRPEFKLPAVTWIFLSTNLFFTVAAEEAFFRGFLQDRLAGLLSSFHVGKGITVAVSALLFGLAHGAGGTTYMGLATLVGFGYALAYARTQRIESAITAHFLFNALHFIGFTYPYIQ